LLKNNRGVYMFSRVKLLISLPAIAISLFLLYKEYQAVKKNKVTKPVK